MEFLFSLWSLKQIVQHDCCILECVYSLPIVTPPSSFRLARFVTYTYFSLFEIFLFLNFLCCNQTWWCSFFAPLGPRVSTKPFNKCVWLESSILLHVCLPNRTKAPLSDHFIVVKGFLSVTANIIPVILAARKLSRNMSMTKNIRNTYFLIN